MYPLLLKNGHRIKQVLIQQKIYVPTLWPNVLEEEQLRIHGEYFFDGQPCLIAN